MGSPGMELGRNSVPPVSMARRDGARQSTPQSPRLRNQFTISEKLFISRNPEYLGFRHTMDSSFSAMRAARLLSGLCLLAVSSKCGACIDHITCRIRAVRIACMCLLCCATVVTTLLCARHEWDPLNSYDSGVSCITCLPGGTLATCVVCFRMTLGMKACSMHF